MFDDPPRRVEEGWQCCFNGDCFEEDGGKLRSFELVGFKRSANPAVLCFLRVERIEAGADAHPVVPGDGKNPPDESTQNGLAHGERENVALSRKEPAHGRATDKSQRHENGIGPVQRGKNSAGQESGRARLLKCIEKPVCQIRIQGDLLQETKRKVSEEAPRFGDARRYAVKSAKPKTSETSGENKRAKNEEPLARGGPEIVGSPA